MSRPLPKADYMKLSPAAKAALKSALVIKGRGGYKPAHRSRPPLVAGRGAYRKKSVIRGRGAYKKGDDLSDASGRDLAKGAAGKFAGWLWDSLIGNGSYAPMNFQVKNNSFMNEITANGPPSVWTNNAQSFVFRHREYLGDIIGSTGFQLQSFPINAGNQDTFPWLSTLAGQFQQYRIEGMLFEFVSTSADALNSTNTALGTVIMATNYNSADPDFQNKVQMLQTEFASVSKPSCSMLHPIECKPSLTTVENLYIRTGAVPEGQDIRLYDLGKFQIATQGMQAAANIGELWVTYQVVCLKPILSPSNFGGPSDFYHISDCSNSAEFGATAGSVVQVTGSNAGTTINTVTDSGADGIYFNDAAPGDCYVVMGLYSSGGGVTGSVAGPTLSGNVDVLRQWQSGTAEGAAAPNVASGIQLAMVGCIVQIRAQIDPADPPHLAWDYTLMFGVATNTLDLYIARVGANLSPFVNV